MTVEAYTHRVATSTGTGARTPAVCAAAVVHGGSGAEPPERLSARFARPIQGARYLNRATRLAVLAVDQLGLAPGAPAADAEQLGVVAVTFGAHFEQSRDQLVELITKERPLVSPMLGPNSIPSSVSSHVSIYLDARAFTLTFCDSGTAGLEALAFAARAVSSGRAKRVVVVGVESRPPDVERALLGDPRASPPDEAYALLIGEREACPQGSGGRALSVVTQARRFGGREDQARRVALRRCLSEVAERARRLDVPVDALVGDLRRASLGAGPDDLVTLVNGAEDAYWLDDQRRHPGLQCTAGLAHVAALHALVRSGHVPEGLVALRRGRRALDRLEGAIVMDASADGTVACTLLRAERGGTP